MTLENIQWICNHFDDLSNKNVYDILKARNEVFIVEQLCNYMDIDNNDLNAYHLYALINNNIAAYCRILNSGTTFKETSIGRVLTTASYRKNKLGTEMMLIAIDKIYTLFGKQAIRIGAQLYLKSFYENLGFKQDSAMYIEDNIPHIEMILE